MENKKVSGKKMGRPRKPDYYQKRHRYGAIERVLLNALENMQNENDKKEVLRALESLK